MAQPPSVPAAESAALASLNNTGRALDLPQESYLKQVSGEWNAAGATWWRRLQAGDHVSLHLPGSPQHNGKFGAVVSWDADSSSSRWIWEVM